MQSLGNELGLTYDEIESIQYDSPHNINDAGHQVLVKWMKKKSSEQISEAEMKEELEKALRSKKCWECVK